MSEIQQVVSLQYVYWNHDATDSLLVPPRGSFSE